MCRGLGDGGLGFGALGLGLWVSGVIYKNCARIVGIHVGGYSHFLFTGIVEGLILLWASELQYGLL